MQQRWTVHSAQVTEPPQPSFDFHFRRTCTITMDETQTHDIRELNSTNTANLPSLMNSDLKPAIMSTGERDALSI